MKNDAVLIVWIVLSFVWDVLVWGIWFREVFYRGHSGWWAILAILMTESPTLFKALRKRFDIPEEE